LLGRYPLSVTNTYGVTKLLINEDVAEIQHFKEKYVSVHLLIMLMTNCLLLYFIINTLTITLHLN